MTLLVWKRKNKQYIITINQIKGMIALCLIMAIIPFFHFIYLLYFNYTPPDYSEQSTNSIAIEITENDRAGGIFFFEPGTSADKVLRMTNYESISNDNLYLINGMKINIDSKSADKKFSISEMDAAKRLALGIPLDINKANKDDLILISGIGEKTASNIIALRDEKGRFSKIDELTQIRGIKEKRLSAFKKYLYVEEDSE